MFKRLIASLVCLTFICSNLQYVHAQDFSVNQLPVPGTMVEVSTPFSPLALKGLVVNPQKPLEFQFIVDTGKGSQDTASIKDQANQLVKYFLAGLTIPEGDLWVNLSPYEKNRMVPEALGQTDLGRDLLAQDYILKQLTASLIYPEKDLGKEFWNRVYAKALAQFGTTNVPVNTFNKVWILPDQAQVFENVNAAYVTRSTLKVMLDQDYLARQKHQVTQDSSVSSQIIRQIILPEITKEVNTGKNFAPLRQIYQALILAKWYKETIQNGLLDAVYTNKNKVAGVNLNDPTVKEQIYERYLKAYKKGAFNYIKEDPVPDGQVVPRKYFSGGTKFFDYEVAKDGKPADVHGDGAMVALVVTLAAAGLVTAFVSTSKLRNKRKLSLLLQTPREDLNETIVKEIIRLKMQLQEISEQEFTFRPNNESGYTEESLLSNESVKQAMEILKSGRNFKIVRNNRRLAYVDNTGERVYTDYHSAHITYSIVPDYTMAAPQALKLKDAAMNIPFTKAWFAEREKKRDFEALIDTQLGWPRTYLPVQIYEQAWRYYKDGIKFKINFVELPHPDYPLGYSMDFGAGWTTDELDRAGYFSFSIEKVDHAMSAPQASLAESNWILSQHKQVSVRISQGEEGAIVQVRYVNGEQVKKITNQSVFSIDSQIIADKVESRIREYLGTHKLALGVFTEFMGYLSIDDQVPAKQNSFRDRLVKDKNFRSWTKAVSFRTISFVDTLIVSHLVTHDPTFALKIAVPAIFTHILEYRFNDYFWDETRLGRQLISNEKLRPLVKGVSYRLIGSLDEMLIAWIMTGHLGHSMMIGGIGFFTKLSEYIAHEIGWNKFLPMVRSDVSADDAAQLSQRAVKRHAPKQEQDAAMFARAKIAAWKLMGNVKMITAMLDDSDENVRQTARKALNDLEIDSISNDVMKEKIEQKLEAMGIKVISLRGFFIQDADILRAKEYLKKYGDFSIEIHEQGFTSSGSDYGEYDYLVINSPNQAMSAQQVPTPDAAMFATVLQGLTAYRLALGLHFAGMSILAAAIVKSHYELVKGRNAQTIDEKIEYYGRFKADIFHIIGAMTTLVSGLGLGGMASLNIDFAPWLAGLIGITGSMIGGGVAGFRVFAADLYQAALDAKANGNGINDPTLKAIETFKGNPARNIFYHAQGPVFGVLSLLAYYKFVPSFWPAETLHRFIQYLPSAYHLDYILPMLGAGLIGAGVGVGLSLAFANKTPNVSHKDAAMNAAVENSSGEANENLGSIKERIRKDFHEGRIKRGTTIDITLKWGESFQIKFGYFDNDLYPIFIYQLKEFNSQRAHDTIEISEIQDYRVIAADSAGTSAAMTSNPAMSAQASLAESNWILSQHKQVSVRISQGEEGAIVQVRYVNGEQVKKITNQSVFSIDSQIIADKVESRIREYLGTHKLALGVFTEFMGYLSIDDQVPAKQNSFRDRLVKDKNFRSWTKAVSFRTISFVDTLIVSHLVTHDPTFALKIAVPAIFTHILEYRFNDYFWDETRLGRQLISNEKLRPLVKGVSYRLIGSLDEMLIAWIMTGHLGHSMMIGGIGFFTKLSEYIAHEIGWNKFLPMVRSDVSADDAAQLSQRAVKRHAPEQEQDAGMTGQEIADKTREIIANVLLIDVRYVRLESRFDRLIRAWDTPELERHEIILDLEETFDLLPMSDINMENIDGLETVQDFVDYVNGMLSGNEPRIKEVFVQQPRSSVDIFIRQNDKRRRTALNGMELLQIVRLQEQLLGKNRKGDALKLVNQWLLHQLISNNERQEVLSQMDAPQLSSLIGYIEQENNPQELEQIKGEIESLLNPPKDKAMAKGGIDLNQINILHNGKTVNVQFDPAQLSALEQGGFEGFTPVITGFQYIKSPFPLLGINVPAKQILLAKA